MKKKPQPTGEQLADALCQDDWSTCSAAFEAYNQHAPRIEDLPHLIGALSYKKWHPPAKYAAESIGKLGAAARSATDALIELAQERSARVDRLHGVPPCYEEAIIALARVNPAFPYIPSLVAAQFAAGYDFAKASVIALELVATREAKLLLRQILAFWLIGATKKERVFFEAAEQRLNG
jgi:hypothetical protein